MYYWEYEGIPSTINNYIQCVLFLALLNICLYWKTSECSTVPYSATWIHNLYFELCFSGRTRLVNAGVLSVLLLFYRLAIFDIILLRACCKPTLSTLCAVVYLLQYRAQLLG